MTVHNFSKIRQSNNQSSAQTITHHLQLHPFFLSLRFLGKRHQHRHHRASSSNLLNLVCLPLFVLILDIRNIIMMPSNSNSLQEQADHVNSILKGLPTAQERLRYVLHVLGKQSGEKVVMTTSFGIQSAMMLHLVKTAAAASSPSSAAARVSVPVIWIDTGYLPKETYQFAEQLTSQFDLDLCPYQSSLSPARMEALHGKLWQDPSNEAHKLYNYIRKVEPMKRALHELGATIVLSGVRAGQTRHRQEMKMVHVHDGHLKICPILDWTNRQVADLFQEHQLPFHPLHEQGYKSVGDWHSSAPYDPKIHKSERDTRFHGRTQECGLHVASPEPTDTVVQQQSDLMMRKRRTSSISTVSSSSTTTVPVVDSRHDDGFLLYTKPSCRFCLAAKALIQHLRNDEQTIQKKSTTGSSSSSTHEDQQERGRGRAKMVSDDDDSSSSSSSSITTWGGWLSSSSSLSQSLLAFAIMHEIEVGKEISPAELDRALRRTVATVPQILYKGQYIGGYEDLVKWIETTFPLANMPDTVQLVEKFRQQ
jgi:phosphoadenosine phosphosulfate reductase